MLMTVLSVQLDDSAEGENLLCIVFKLLKFTCKQCPTA